MKKIFIIIITILLLIPLISHAFSKDGIIYTTDGSMSDVNAAIADANTGDTVNIPFGNYNWGTSGSYISVNKAIVLKGAGQNETIVTLSDTGGTWDSAVIRISAAAIVRDMTINGSNVHGTTAFSTSSNSGWRITNITYNGGSYTGGYWFIYIGSSYGLIDHNTISGGAGNAELIFIRGPANSWQTPASFGTNDNVFIENNTFNGQGYVCDANANSRVVIRYNTITGKQKIDGHGKASNTPPRGVREMEIYNNLWTNTGSYWDVIELRGGTGRVFNNVVQNNIDSWFVLTEEGCTDSVWQNFDGCQCPSDYPIDDQIGIGMDPKVGGSDPMYLWNNTKAGSPWTLTWKSTSICTSTCGSFSVSDVIQQGRDYFISASKPAAMSGYTPYICPHPFTGLAGSCGSGAGTGYYNMCGSMNMGGSVSNLALGGSGTMTLGN